MASASYLQFRSFTSQFGALQNSVYRTGISSTIELGLSNGQLKFSRRRNCQHGLISTSCSGSNNAASTDRGEDDSVSSIKVVAVRNKESFKLTESLFRLRETVAVLPPVVFLMKKQPGASFIVGFCVATTCLIVTVRIYMARRLRQCHPGTVADLVRRGQLRSDRRGISKPLKYEDPFNNPLVKVGKGNSTVEMCGKVYRLAPITLTEEQRAIHQRRRSRAYQWKRPKVFLKEGDLIPPDVDPDTIRWIPANHPFATIASDIDEDLAQNNVYQKHGVPFRIQAEHEALQKKLEALQNGKLDQVQIDAGNARDSERAFKAQPEPHDHAEQSRQNDQVSKSPKSDQQPPDSFDMASGST